MGLLGREFHLGRGLGSEAPEEVRKLQEGVSVMVTRMLIQGVPKGTKRFVRGEVSLST